tara:strand:- start:828 stop:1085 length:258 start_codon:yes stop_codon:yes gene_type:complete
MNISKDQIKLWREERDNFKLLYETNEDEDRLIYLGWYEALNFVLNEVPTCELCDKKKFNAMKRQDNINVCVECNKQYPIKENKNE